MVCVACGLPEVVLICTFAERLLVEALLVALNEMVLFERLTVSHVGTVVLLISHVVLLVTVEDRAFAPIPPAAGMLEVMAEADIVGVVPDVWVNLACRVLSVVATNV
jgi:hypothetical protein